MISFVRGQLSEIIDNTAIVECNGIGYNIEVPIGDLERLPSIGEDIKLYTYLNVREDAMKLFGFITRDELELFKMMIGVNGIGPKGGLAILSTLSADDIRVAIVSDDAKAISKAPGVGIKTAQKMIIELKGKVDLPTYGIDNISEDVATISNASSAKGVIGEAIAALVALGYSNSEATVAVKKVEYVDGMDAEDVLKASLKHLTFL